MEINKNLKIFLGLMALSVSTHAFSFNQGFAIQPVGDFGVCIDGDGSKTPKKRQNVHTGFCDGGSDQVFNFFVDGDLIDTGESYTTDLVTGLSYFSAIAPTVWFELRPYGDDTLCLDVAGHKGSASSNVTFFTCTNEDDQKWKYQYGELRNKAQNLCLDITGYGGGEGKNVTVYHCEGYLDQSWILRRVSP